MAGRAGVAAGAHDASANAQAHSAVKILWLTQRIIEVRIVKRELRSWALLSV